VSLVFSSETDNTVFKIYFKKVHRINKILTSIANKKSSTHLQ
jgi:hypothetical protein